MASDKRATVPERILFQCPWAKSADFYLPLEVIRTALAAQGLTVVTTAERDELARPCECGARRVLVCEEWKTRAEAAQLAAQGLHVVTDADMRTLDIGKAVLDMQVPEDKGGGFYFDETARRKLWDLCQLARREEVKG